MQGSQNERRLGKSYTRSYDGTGPNDRWLICWFPFPLRQKSDKKVTKKCQKSDKKVTKKWRQEKKKLKPRLAFSPSSHLKTKSRFWYCLWYAKKQPLTCAASDDSLFSLFVLSFGSSDGFTNPESTNFEEIIDFIYFYVLYM